MSKEFVERRDGSFYLEGSRVPLALIVSEFYAGEAPETIQSHFPTLSLEEVYGAIAFYLGNQEEANQDIANRQRAEEEFSTSHPAPPELKRKLGLPRERTLLRRT